MQTSLLRELVIGTPAISATYDQLHKSVNRYLPDPTTQCQYSTTTSKQSRVYSIINKLGRNADGHSQGVREHVKLAPKISETVKGKLSLGARILQVGGVEKVFKQFFSVREGERLLKASQCYLSTTSGPLAGFLFISTENVAFCSAKSMKVFNRKGQMCRIRYKVVIPLKKIECVNQRESVQKPKQKYIEIVTVDNFDFWLMFEYYMQTYSIVLGRNSKKSTVDVDLSSLGGGMNISRHHARIFYDFARRRFALEVLGKNGCLVEGVLHLPGNPPVKLDSQDLLQIGDKEFYFLLPVRSILGGGPLGPRHYPNHSTPPVPGGPVVPHYNYHLAPSAGAGAMVKKGRRDYYEEEYEDEDDLATGGGSSGKKMRRDGYDGYGYGGVGSGGKASLAGSLDKKSEGRSRVDRDADNLQLQQLEEKDVVSSVATVLSDLCGPGEWMPMEKLHAELVEQYSSVWHHSRIRRYLTSEDWPGPESKGKPWYGLLMLLRKYPEHFVINTRSKGRVTLEFVSLVSLLS